MMIALVAFAIGSVTSVVPLLFAGRPWAAVILLSVFAAYRLRNRPAVSGAAMIAGSLALRLAYAGLAHTDPLDLAQAASSAAFSGFNPYAIEYEVSQPSGIAYYYSYGPLGLLVWLGGVPLEFASAAATMVVLAWCRAWMTLAAYASFPALVAYTTWGLNDYSAGFLLLVSLVLLRRNPSGAVIGLSAAAALKPYAFAWYLPTVGFAGLTGAAILVVSTLVLWSPVLIGWGLPQFLHATAETEDLRSAWAATRLSAGAVDVPLLRWAAIVPSLAGLVFRSWRAVLLLGAATFTIFLFFSPWTHWGYWVVVIPIAGLALESHDPGRSTAVLSTGRTGPLLFVRS